MSTSRLFSFFVALTLIVVAVLTIQAGVDTSALTSNARARQADVAQWVAMGEYYAALQSVSGPVARHAALVSTARYTGQAIQEYVRTGNRAYLPKCISAEIMSLLPSIGDNSWRIQVVNCGK